MQSNPLRVAIVISHPIQHFCPQYVSFTKNPAVEIKVFFASAMGHKKYIDINFGEPIAWGNLGLNQFDHEFLNGDEILAANRNLDAPKLDHALEKFKPELIFSYGYFQRLQRRARKWALNNKVPLAYISDSELRHRRKSLLEIFKTIFLRRYFNPVNCFLTMGNSNEMYYQHYGVAGHKLIRMHYPIDFLHYQESYLQKDALRKETRLRYQIGKTEIVLGVVGKLVEWKSQDHIIEAMQLLETEDIYVQLFVLGSGKMTHKWKEKAAMLKQSSVHFPGFVNIEELPAYYAALDMYVHPAALEPHSVAVSEAIMMGCPIIISDRCGSYGETDDVQEGKNGFVYPWGDIPMLAKKIKQLATNGEMRANFGQHSHEQAVLFQTRSHYTIIGKLLDRFGRRSS